MPDRRTERHDEDNAFLQLLVETRLKLVVAFIFLGTRELFHVAANGVLKIVNFSLVLILTVGQLHF
jgi:hypothetical protein